MNRKKAINIAIAVFGCVAIVVIVMLTFAHKENIEYNSSYEGEYQVVWSEVKVREIPNGDTEIKLAEGQYVTGTGRYQAIIDMDDKFGDAWHEVQLSDGTVGWIVEKAIRKVK